MKITNKEIAELMDFTEQGLKQMKPRQPKKYELIKLGALCKKYEIEVKDLEAIVKLKENMN